MAALAAALEDRRDVLGERDLGRGAARDLRHGSACADRDQPRSSDVRAMTTSSAVNLPKCAAGSRALLEDPRVSGASRTVVECGAGVIDERDGLFRQRPRQRIEAALRPGVSSLPARMMNSGVSGRILRHRIVQRTSRARHPRQRTVS